jgi:uncharacterized membrane protein
MGLLSTEDQEQVIHAISLAENQTSGEIRVALETRCKGSAMDRALDYFSALEMHKTLLRNGVLIYIALEDHVFSIVGDEGIHKKVGQHFWDETKEIMADRFKKGDIKGGLIEGIIHAGEQLKLHFPVSEDDINELPNDLVFGK